MAKDAVATMGEILTDDVGGRDAVHVAVIAVKAGTVLCAGAHVGLTQNEAGEYVAHYSGEEIGIVDPFIKDLVKPNQRFWLYLYPRTITSLRHNWTHPAFADAKTGETYARPTERAESEAWLRAFCETNDCPGYLTVMSVIAGETGEHNQWDDEYLHFNGVDAHGDIPDEFWMHVENVLGRKIEKKAKYWSCSC